MKRPDTRRCLRPVAVKVLKINSTDYEYAPTPQP